jgi:subtilase family serine protease
MLAAAATIVGCSHGTSAFLPSSPTASLQGTQRSGLPVDLGRRPAREPVSVVLLERYNQQAELNRFVDALAHVRSPRYLTSREFIERFAPTAQQQARVVRVLRQAGFTIVRTYSNRTLIDASAPSAVVERFFSTEIHNFRQARYGLLFASVRPLRIPPQLSSLVAVADADNRVLLLPGLDSHGGPQRPTSGLRDSATQLSSARKNVIDNPDFATGKLKPWTTCRSRASLPVAVVTTQHPHKGHYDAYAGTPMGEREPKGMDSVCQLLTIPPGATLTAWTWGTSNDQSAKVGQFAALLDSSSGKTVKMFFFERKEDHKWVHRGPYDLSSFVGKKLYAAFGVIGDSTHEGKFIGQYLDGVSVVGRSVSTPSPSPSPMNCPTSVNATPTPNYNYNTGGWGPASVADGLQMPVNYGCAGAGQTAAIVIDAEVVPSDLQTYLSTYGIVQTGTVSNELIDGATSATGDGIVAATIDVETISSLAPAANIIVYVTPDLSDQHTEDAYNQALSDNKATVVNSPFGECESDDPAYDAAVEAIAVQGAATGVTFSAASGAYGADCYNGSHSVYPFGVEAPASAPYFVSVGGTETVPTGAPLCGYTPAPITNPAVWNDCEGVGGGGISSVWTPPPYQVGISGASTSGRNVPDIALPAAEDAAYCTPCAPSGWGLTGGTSWASAIYVAMQMEINEICGREWGINSLYRAFAHSGYADYIDVTSGNNQFAYGSNYGAPGSYYSAQPGFDNVSGIGIPLGMPLAQSECGKGSVTRRR